MAFDPAAATAAYIDGLGPQALAKAAAYTSGSQWLLLWGLLVTIATSWIIIRARWLEKLSARLAHRAFALRTFTVCAVFLLLSGLISLPWTIYASWWREMEYGRTSQPLADFLGQNAIVMALNMVIGGLFLLGVYALIRKTGKKWWLWSAGLAAFAVSFMLLLGPVFIEPMFNSYKPLPQGEVRTALMQMADEAGIAHDRLFVYDGSRQSNNFTANVTGIFGSARIAISDVALGKASLEEVKAVTGHEVGHYVLGHSLRLVALMSALALLLFYLADKFYHHFARRMGSSAQLADPVGISVMLVLWSVFALLTTPLVNMAVRAGESEADAYSLRTVNLPDALASALVKTAEYRDPRPHPLQEFLFYTHPSVESRVRAAMEWKAKHEGG